MYRVLYQFDPIAVATTRPAQMWRSIDSRLPKDIARAETGPRVLWRREDESTIQVQYPTRPKPAWLLPGTRAFPQVVDMHVLLASLAQGQVWVFDLAAQPVHRVSKPSHPTGHVDQRVPAGQWLTAKDAEGTSRASRSGFRVLHLAEQNTLRRGSTTMPSLTRIRGILEVEDTQALRVALEEGMGRGKTQGAGMLSLTYPPRKLRRPRAAGNPTRRAPATP
ncbi:type I-E CRISPR-associated protein Cas6/Cse3/CasE [Streptomyces montanisoli]|uniref:Type I-E CRISPR-associated protein Cas6/Cse3/CasE n=1 Tax=Streptomyces montanisoli TaxID=2798581 RepID=A0A940RSS1_9ACTN|nr:type I-E CRISPR-associated protein Cas6/Cse3/CasE [Streptomyces montanisoli]MBP0456067.1 type I-E CRISPR-associated protein Cas6/Cse3/CasE [Streptomyces montanisoli]